MIRRSKYLCISARSFSGASTILGRVKHGGGKATRYVQATLLGIVLGLSTTPAFSVDGNPPNLFELDGNPQDSNLIVDLPDEWDTLYVLDPSTGGAGFGGAPIAFTGILADPAPASIYWKGGSKDINDITDWWHKDGSVPDKDDITNAYAAAYLVPEDVCLDADDNPILCSDGAAVSGPVHEEDDLIIYFGLDRYDNAGDAFAAFWFLQDSVTKNDSTNRFDGAHVPKTATDPGDLMVLVEYPQGSNATPVIKVYEWDPDLIDPPNLDENNQNIGPLEMIYRSEDALCTGTGDKVACAITNIIDVPAPIWDYTPKGGVLGDDLPYETFYEGGINVTHLLAGANICISTFLAETRSSRSETAQLKDLVIGGFPVCSSSISTNVHNAAEENITFTTVKAGTAIHDSAEVKATGPGLTTDPTGTVHFTLYEGGTCEGTEIDTDSVVLDVGTPGDATSTAETMEYNLGVGTYSFRATYDSDTSDFPGAIDEVCEVFTIEKWDSKISTQIHDSADSEPAGDIQNTEVFVGLTVHDHAFVAEKSDDVNAPTPTGTVNFKRYSTLNCTGPSVDSSGGLTSGNAYTGDFTPLGDTVLSYTASYSGDANYNPATDPVCEKLTINKYPSKVLTAIHAGSAHGLDIQGQSVDIGLTVHDHAYVSADGDFTLDPPPAAPTGNVTFYIYRDTGCLDGPIIGSYGGKAWAQVDAVNGSGEAWTEVFTPSVGAFGILVSYAGDANYKPSALAVSDCEDLTVNKLDPTILTKVIVRDLAEVSGTAGPPSGTVTFKTYRTADCSETPVDSRDITLSSGSADQGVASEQTLMVAADVASYRATYNGDTTYNPVTHKCELVQFTVLP